MASLYKLLQKFGLTITGFFSPSPLKGEGTGPISLIRPLKRLLQEALYTNKTFDRKYGFHYITDQPVGLFQECEPLLLKDRIIHESLRQFSTKGFMSTTINDILEAVGTSKGGFYNHFKSKEDLFLAARSEARQIWRQG